MSVVARSRNPYRNLRRALLAAILLVIGGLGGLYWLGRSGPLEPTAEPAPAVLQGATAVSEGFDYTQVIDDRPVFRLRGARFRAIGTGLVELEEVGLTLFRDGREYGVESAKAEYDPTTKEATLAGAVRLTGGEGLSLTTDELTLESGGRELVSSKAVAFTFSGGQGSSGGLRVHMDAGTLQLAPPVRVSGRSREGTELLLEASQAVLDRKAKELRAEGGVRVAVGASTVEAQNIVLVLAEDERTPQLLRATQDVKGELRELEAGADAPPAFELSSYSLTLQFVPGRAVPDRFEIQGTQGSAAILVAHGQEGEIRVLLSRWVVGSFENGALATVETVGSSEIKEYLEGAETRLLRLASAQFARADLAADRHLEALTLNGNVVLRDSRLGATADRAYLQPEAGTAQLFGEPVRVTSERGELRAPRVIYHREEERAHAEGGVDATLTGAVLPDAGSARTNAQEPVRVQASEAFMELAGNGFVFRGAVQAYQGDTVLFANQLRADDAERRLAASGNVKTVWTPRAEDGGSPRDPVEVSAQTLTYREAERELLYEGEVVVLQAGRALRSTALEVQLDEQRRARRMIARGRVRLEDPAVGRRVDGDQATYELAARTVLVEGNPATLLDSGGNTLRGKQLLYDLDRGTLRAGSSPK